MIQGDSHLLCKLRSSYPSSLLCRSKQKDAGQQVFQEFCQGILMELMPEDVHQSHQLNSVAGYNVA